MVTPLLHPIAPGAQAAQAAAAVETDAAVAVKLRRQSRSPQSKR